MSVTVKVTPYTELVASNVRRLETSKLKPLLIYGIVNPYGPTLMGFCSLQYVGDDASELAYFSLNPFQQELFTLGNIKDCNNTTAIHEILVSAIEEHDLRPGGAPTLLLPCTPFSHDLVENLFAISLSRIDDLVETIDLLECYPGNPWDRVSEEVISGAYTAIAALKNNNDMGPPKAPCSRIKLRKYLGIIRSIDHFTEEIRAFLYAWNGSIQFQGKNGSSIFGATAFSVDRIGVILKNFGN
jgi:hypothetical protein